MRWPWKKSNNSAETEDEDRKSEEARELDQRVRRVEAIVRVYKPILDVETHRKK